MELTQAVEVLSQAINLALGSGAFKSTRDVTIVHQALEVVTRVATVTPEVEEVKPEKAKK